MSHAHDDNRPACLGHHYDTVEQQFSAGKFGMWLFLTTEILLFAGLFCAYAVYRKNHPEVFLYAHHFLDTNMGALNTVVLIFSSFTMAWAVRASQLGQRGLLIALLTITFICGGTFMGVKYKEYTHKFHSGLLWGTLFHPSDHSSDGASHGVEASHALKSDGADSPHGGAAVDGESHGGGGQPSAAVLALGDDLDTQDMAEAAAEGSDADIPAGGVEMPAAVVPGNSIELMVADELGEPVEQSLVKRAAVGPRGLSADALSGTPAHTGGGHAEMGVQPDYTHVFFGIYFLMTGLHGIHVLIGMIVIGWLIYRAARGHFGPEYFTPVDLGGLYWHLVDLIWIFLFPLLYLIH